MPRNRGVLFDYNHDALPDVVGDINHAPFATGTFDRVYFERMPYFEFTGDSIGALGEAARVLRPGGRLDILSGRMAPGDEVVAELERLGFTNISKQQGSGPHDGMLVTAIWPGS
jgi:SAM-dependent methyltransferase